MYNKMLRNGWTLGSPQLMRGLQLLVWTYHRPTVKLLTRFWQETKPDMMVSLVPHFNRALRESFDKAFPGRPFVTVLTDLADYPKHFWIESQPQYLVCGSERAVEQARELGHLDGTVIQTSGMILHPRFYEPEPTDRIAERKKLGLDPDLPTGIVLFGGYGTSKMLHILRQINASNLGVQLIMICGKNEKLAKALRAEPSRISEALSKRLPVIIDCNAWTLPQERYNAQWVKEKKVGIVVKHYREIAGAVAELLKPGELPALRERAANMHNRAIYEIPQIFEKILNNEVSLT
jgi:1,2-diacylglycerol 3-beta-galactosyltransferase